MLRSINKDIKSVINEQFNINDIDFNNDEPEYDANIFNKNIAVPYDIYYKIIKNRKIEKYEISQINSFTATVKPTNIWVLREIVDFYAENYPEDSLNWLDVSEITDMSELFSAFEETDIDSFHKYNGDISKWDVSKVTNMEAMFWQSKFNRDISGWDVSKVTNMHSMFYNSEFNQDISGWDVSNVRMYTDIFRWCPIKEKYKPLKFR